MTNGWADDLTTQLLESEKERERFHAENVALKARLERLERASWGIMPMLPDDVARHFRDALEPDAGEVKP